PVVFTPRRRPTPLPRFTRKFETCRAAFSVSVIMGSSFRDGGRFRLRPFGQSVLLPVVGNRGLDRILGEDGAVNLHPRQGQLLRNLGVADGHRLVERLALHPFGDERRRGDGGTAAVRLELRVLDQTVRPDPYLQLHHVAAGGRAYHAGSHAVVLLVERTDVARVFVVVQYFVAVCHVGYSLMREA